MFWSQLCLKQKAYTGLMVTGERLQHINIVSQKLNI